ncbi:[FeFe] hydrogenase H-cluster maturation GTPase HydF [Clostridium sp.]|uniref:[FeFe] hydrogenase H-cluster maturation GTPase HydF n=1 Tax=Clostridium sp. TaxID=1506 RepID=UPI002FC9446D
MIETPRSNRLHIGIYGRRNAGKSSVINAITNQNIALVSNVKGTTTDPVYKAMELLPIGPVVFIDTAGIDDVGEIGNLRVERTKEVINKTDLALIIFSVEDFRDDNENIRLEMQWCENLKKKSIPIIGVLNKVDLIVERNFIDEALEKLRIKFNIPFISISADKNIHVDELKSTIVKLAPTDFESTTLIGDIISPGDKVLLVAPQDIQAPKGRLILPQVQVIRDLLDNKAIPVTVTLDNLGNGLELLNNKPDLVITDSQIFKVVNSKVYECVPLTSFSIIMARSKGDLNEFIKGAKVISSLKEGDKILIAEACTHHQLKGDIAREKLPTWLKSIVGSIIIDNYSGKDFPENLREYKLVIHCGSCMFNRAQMLSRIDICKEVKVPITNFGIAIAEINGILDRVVEPFKFKN